MIGKVVDRVCLGDPRAIINGVVMLQSEDVGSFGECGQTAAIDELCHQVGVIDGVGGDVGRDD